MKVPQHPLRFLLIMIVALAAVDARADDEPATEGTIDAFLGEPTLDILDVHRGGRFPNIVCTTDGSLLAVWGGVKLKRSEDGGRTWSEDILVAPGFMGGGVTVDETSGAIFAFVETHHPPADVTVYTSTDQGITWAKVDATIKPDCEGNDPSMHMNEHGITLRHGKHKGRLIRAARYYGKRNAHDEWPVHYTTAIYSDDGGKTWSTSDPFPAKGTGEATLAELSDGRIYYNSRRHWAPEGVNPRRRWTAWSDDGGATWKDLSICEVLPDGPQDRNYGCMGGLTRLPVKDRDVIIYSNCDSPGGRKQGTVWASFDGGKTWPVKRLVYEGSFAYSSMTSGRPGTKSEGSIYVHFESSGGSKVARLNLSWIAAGEKTGDGELPGWIEK